MYEFDQELQAVLAVAQQRGFVTYQQVDAYLPDEGGDPTMVDRLIYALDDLGLALCQDPEVPVENDYLSDDAVSMSPETQALSSRDPIRMYLSQMGNIPLLTRDREIFLAKQIETTRKWFRRHALESDFALRLAVESFEKVMSGELPFERTLRTSETENTRKEQITGRLPVNLPTLKGLLDKNAADWQLLNQSTDPAEREEVAARMLRRRRKMCLLAEELSLRTHRLQPIIKRMQQVSLRIVEIDRDLARFSADPAPSGRSGRAEPGTGGTAEHDGGNAAGVRRSLPGNPAPNGPVDRSEAETLRRQFASGGQHCQEVPKPGTVVPRPDSGRQRRPDARR